MRLRVHRLVAYVKDGDGRFSSTVRLAIGIEINVPTLCDRLNA